MIPRSTASAIFWIAAVSCLVAHVAILRSVVRARRAPAVNGTRAPAGREVLWAALPAIVLAIVLVVTWSEIVS